MARTQTGRRKAGGTAAETVSASGAEVVPEAGKTRLPGVLIDPYLPQPGQHVGRRIIKIDDTPADYWLDAATQAGVRWADKLGLERSDAGIWDVRKPELLTAGWFSARARTRPRRLGAPLRRVAVAVNAEALEVQATTGSLRSWAQGRRPGQTARQSTKDGDPLPGPDPFGEQGGSGGGGAGAAEEADAAVTFQHALIQLEDGVLGWPTTSWGGTPVETPVDVAAPPEPAFFIIQVIGISSFLGDYGLGRTVKTMTLLPGEVMTMSLRTWRASSQTVSQGSSIIDSYDESSSERFAETVMSETTDTATRDKSENWHAEADAKASIGLASASVSGGGGGEYSSSTEEFAKAVDEAVQEHTAEASSHRENTVTSSSERTVATEDEEVIERTIKNINVKRTLNFTLRELNQAFITKTHLKEVRLAFSNGNAESWREEPVSGLRRLVAEVVKPSFVDRMCQDILKTIAVVQDLDGSPVNVLEQVLVNKCATGFAFRDARPGDGCDYPPPSADGRLYYRFKRGPLGQGPAEPHPVEGVLLKQRDIVMKTDSVVAEALLGAEDALDQYSADLQVETIREKRLASDREALAQEIVRTGNATGAELYAKVFGVAPPAPDPAAS